jgi:hypothetical protein
MDKPRTEISRVRVPCSAQLKHNRKKHSSTHPFNAVHGSRQSGVSCNTESNTDKNLLYIGDRGFRVKAHLISEAWLLKVEAGSEASALANGRKRERPGSGHCQVRRC